MDKIKGYKTYIAAAGLILTAIAAYIGGDITLVELITQSLAGLGLAGLRASK